ncbi:Crystal protein ET79 [Burkholderia cepacia]|uniref:Crystal protein ET79 n=1 Tax=Burkholderia cepacia TaxID=292 RepID=UPI001CF5C6C0|nr:Crystal protein ET79 [Burkholderia cepacia]MCA8331500.1 Crystal protein ET79 [Burkholderia cepacia]
MAARSVIAKFANNTKFVLTLDKSSIQLEHGEWVTSPPDQIAPGDVGQWESQSADDTSGTQGDLRYQFVDQVTCNVDVHWSNPYEGESRYSIECDANGFKVGHDRDNNPHATVNYYINED